MQTKWLIVGASLLAFTTTACGEDEGAKGGPPPVNQGGNAPPPPAQAPAAAKAQDPNAKKKVEDRVTTEEEATIRQSLKERDFIVTEDNRDPFQSFVLVPPELATPQKEKVDVTQACTRNDQFVASTYSYSDLQLVGIIAERTQKRVLMMAGNFGYLIRKGDCVGREKALVKDIGAGYITFQVSPDQPGQQSVEEHSVQLYPNQQPLSSQPRVIEPTKSNTPVVAPGQDTNGGVPVQSPSGSVPVQTPGQSTVPVESPKQ
ncbi:MAG TPA: hypothetical protein VGM90_38130 [Kofleriaceae bacterium]|jgi:Tfp pilus assembly protein PilP